MATAFARLRHYVDIDNSLSILLKNHLELYLPQNVKTYLKTIAFPPSILVSLIILKLGSPRV